jgi:hypothetical protein
MKVDLITSKFKVLNVFHGRIQLECGRVYGRRSQQLAAGKLRLSFVSREYLTGEGYESKD